MRKSNLLILIVTSLSLALFSCSLITNENEANSNNIQTSNLQENNDIEEEVKVTEKINTFKAFGKTYTSTKDLLDIQVNTNIYDDQQSIFYTPGEYKEIDFINDLLYTYLNEDNSVYDYLVSYDNTTDKGYTNISEVDKEKLIKNLNSLRSQMELSPSEEMVVRLDRVTYEGVNSKVNSGSTFKIRVAISRVGATVVPWNYFSVTVFENEDKLLAHLF